MKITYTLPALADLERILDDIAAQSPLGMVNVKKRIDAIETLLMQFPEAGTRTNLQWLRRIAISPYPYVIFYEPEAQTIIIHAFRHGAQDPDSMPGA